MTVNNHKESPFGLQLMRFETNADFPNSVLTLPHVAFEVDCLDEILKGFKVIIPPNSPSTGLRVAFIEVNGLPIELMEYSVEAIPEHGPMEGRTGYCLNGNAIRFVSLSIPSCSPHIKDWIDVPELSMRKSGSCNGENPFGTQWVKFLEGHPFPKLIADSPHPTFAVNSIEKAIDGYDMNIDGPVLLEDNSYVAFILTNSIPVILLEEQFTPVTRYCDGNTNSR